jgi:hypothetical protein
MEVLTMARLIDADALKRRIIGAMELSKTKSIDKDDVAFAIDNSDAVDAVPVVHGRWIFGEMGVVGWDVECSVCGWGCHPVDKKAWLRYPGHKHCGNCGAKMDGDGNG